MKILLVSDTHGKDYYLEEALEIEKPDFLCHMGDLEGSEDYIRGITRCPLAMVSGRPAWPGAEALLSSSYSI